MRPAARALLPVASMVVLWFVLIVLPLVNEAEAQAPASPAVTPHTVQIFADEFFGRSMPGSHVPGAVVAIVKDGRILFSKGYGYADLERRMLVDPDRTIFRVGSVSKLFTATHGRTRTGRSGRGSTTRSRPSPRSH